MRVGVVGHVEVMEFAVVDRLPAAGEIAEARDDFTVTAGGGAVAAVVMRELAGAASFWTAVGDDARGAAAVAELRDEHGLEVHAARRSAPTRRGFTHLAADGERTITVVGERLAPAGADEVAGAATADAVFVTAADLEALRAARGARVLVATPRVGPLLATADVALDVLVASATDAGEQVDLERWVAPPRAVVRTAGARGGTWTTDAGETGTWPPVPPPGPPVDAFGCGDAFAGALTVALARGLPLGAACVEAARAGAHRLTLRGPYGRPASG